MFLQMFFFFGNFSLDVLINCFLKKKVYPKVEQQPYSWWTLYQWMENNFIIHR